MVDKNSEKLAILRRKIVEERTGLPRSTMYQYIQNGAFPKPIKLGKRAVGWLESEIDTWLESCINNRDNG